MKTNTKKSVNLSMLLLMASGVPVCLFLLFVLRRERGCLHYLDIVAVVTAFLGCCFVAVVTKLALDWDWRRSDRSANADET